MWYRIIGCLVTLMLSLLAVPLAAPAQPAAKIPRVGVLRPSSAPPGDFGQREAFEGGLRDLGWTPGTSLLIEYRYAEGQPERLPELAAELIQLSVDVLVASGPTGVRAAQHATRTIPIVMATLPDPVGLGLVASLARPGGNTTGVTLDTQELAGKQLELLKEAMPHLSRVAVLRNPASPLAGWEIAHRQIEAAARALPLEVQDFPVSRPEDLAPTFVAMRQAEMGAVLVRRDQLVIERHVAEVVALAAQHRVPAMYISRQFPDSGGLMSYGANVKAIHRRAATFVDKILKGAKPADLPVEQPTTFELVINLKTAEALGITIPPTFMFLADEVLR
jgi:putative ABC transport system substrate-binding protein